MSLQQLRSDLKKLSNAKKAKLLSGYFKTGKGEYGEGDIFIGISVPDIRKIAIKFKDISLDNIKILLSSKIHEERFTALEILVMKYEIANEKQKENIISFYLKNTSKINNWDLVDTSAPYLLGKYLLNKDKSILYKLAISKNIWERRIAIISTYSLIKNNDFKENLKISEMLLNDKHDLMHKAVGWMLREIGKKDISVLKDFLKKHYKEMPRTMLRYSIEKFPETERQKYLKGEI